MALPAQLAAILQPLSFDVCYACRITCCCCRKRGPLPKVGKVGGGLPGQARLALEDCFTPADLRVGTTVNILGRAFLIYDCDAATRAWYQASAGVVGCGLGSLQAWMFAGALAHSPERLPLSPCLLCMPHFIPLQEHLGYAALELAPLSVEEQKREVPQPALPPWNGIGSPEDSLQNCLKLVSGWGCTDVLLWQQPEIVA